MSNKTPIEILLDNVEFKPTDMQPNDSGLPYVTHEGILKIMDTEILVYVLNTGQRIIPREEMDKLGFGDILDAGGE